MCCPSPYWWILLEPPGTPRILLDVPHPQYLKCMAALVCRSPPLSYILFHALGCVGMRCHSPYYWKLLEPPTLGFSWMCPAPPVPEMYGCTDVQVPPPFIHFIPMLWAVLACVALLHTGGILLEPPGTPRILLDVPIRSVPETVWLHWCAVPPSLLLHFGPMPWAVLACVAWNSLGF